MGDQKYALGCLDVESESCDEIPVTIFVRDGGRPIAPPPPALPAGKEVSAKEYIAAIRARRAYQDAVTDAANASFDKAFRQSMKMEP